MRPLNGHRPDIHFFHASSMLASKEDGVSQSKLEAQLSGAAQLTPTGTVDVHMALSYIGEVR